MQPFTRNLRLRARERLRGRIVAATHGLNADDLDRLAIMIEALAGRRGG